MEAGRPGPGGTSAARGRRCPGAFRSRDSTRPQDRCSTARLPGLWPGLDTSVPRLAAPCVPGGRCGLADRSPDRRLAPRCLPTLPGVLPRAGRLSGDRRSRQLPREAQGPWAAAARPSTEGSPCPADTDSPEPPRVAGRGHPDILLPVPGLRRTHRLCQLQLTQVGLDGGGPLPAGAPAASPCSAGMEAT